MRCASSPSRECSIRSGSRASVKQPATRRSKTDLAVRRAQQQRTTFGAALLPVEPCYYPP